MAKLISSGEDIRFTIIPILFDINLEKELITHSSDYVIGYIKHNKATDERKFTYTESGGLTEANNHWSLAILKNYPYCEQTGPWVVYNCSPEKTTLEFSNLLTGSGETLHLYKWDIWSVEGKTAKVAVVTSCDIY